MRRAVRLILLGVLCGAGWGVAARVWMRLISTDPTFTWSGTLFIVGASAFAGLGMGIVMALGGACEASAWRRCCRSGSAQG